MHLLFHADVDAHEVNGYSPTEAISTSMVSTLGAVTNQLLSPPALFRL